MSTHEVKRSFTEFVSYPDHDTRVDSAEFIKNRRIMVKQMDLPCWICNSRNHREVHHIVEWAFFEAIDTNKMLDTLHVFDPYGFTHTAGEKPIESPDDIRNLLVLCGSCEIDGAVVPGGHHRGTNAGVHDLTLPTWIAQRCVKPGLSITRAIAATVANDKKPKE
jgi:hypothetical protein